MKRKCIHLTKDVYQTKDGHNYSLNHCHYPDVLGLPKLCKAPWSCPIPKGNLDKFIKSEGTE